MWTALFLVFNSVPLLKAAFVRCGNNTYPARGDIISNEDTSGLFFPIFRAFPNFWGTEDALEELGLCENGLAHQGSPLTASYLKLAAVDQLGGQKGLL